MFEIPLTAKERNFATENHCLVYKFLNQNRLPENDFYDIVIFGYLQAVRDYLSNEKLKNYSFSTISWKAMKHSLKDYYKSQNRQKRTAEIISIHLEVPSDGSTLEQCIPATNPLMQQLEMQFLLHDLANQLSQQQMNLIHLKSSGYNMRYIAQNQKIPMKQVKELLEEIRKVLLELSCE